MNKKNILFLLLGLVIGVIFSFSTVFAEVVNTKIDVSYLPLKIKFDRIEKIPENPPFIYDGRTYVPLRFLTENIGKDVTFDAPNNTIWVGSKPGDWNKYMVKLEEKELSRTVEVDVSKKLFDEKEYDNGIMFYQLRDQVRYYLNNEYLTLTAIVGPVSDFESSDKTQLVFYGDGKEIYRTPDFIAKLSTYMNKPINIKVDLKGITNLKIIQEGGSTKLGLMDAKLWY